MRSMDSILASEPSLHTLPDGPDSSVPTETAASAEPTGGTPELQEKEPQPKQAEASQQSDDDSDETPADLDGLKRALKAERGDKRNYKKRWQDTERKIAQLEARLQAVSQIPQQQPAQQKPQVDVFDEMLSNPSEFFSRRERAFQEQLAKQDWSVRANMSEALEREQHEDYEEAKQAFFQASQKSPWLLQQMRSEQLPARFVYREGKKILGGGESGQLQERIKQLEAELAAAKGGASQSRVSVSAPPKTIANARGSGVAARQAWTGPRPMTAILGK